MSPQTSIGTSRKHEAFLELDFSVHDQKLAVTILVNLFQKEVALLAEPRYIREAHCLQKGFILFLRLHDTEQDGTEDELVTGNVPTW